MQPNGTLILIGKNGSFTMRKRERERWGKQQSISQFDNVIWIFELWLCIQSSFAHSPTHLKWDIKYLRWIHIAENHCTDETMMILCFYSMTYIKSRSITCIRVHHCLYSDNDILISLSISHCTSFGYAIFSCSSTNLAWIIHQQQQQQQQSQYSRGCVNITQQYSTNDFA